MRSDFYERLPTKLKVLVDEIEASIPFEIQVMAKRDRAKLDVAESREQVVGVIVGYDTAIIEAPGDIEVT